MNEISGAVKTGELIEYGPERLPAGPDVYTDPNLIIVEGEQISLTYLGTVTRTRLLWRVQVERFHSLWWSYRRTRRWS